MERFTTDDILYIVTTAGAGIAKNTAKKMLDDGVAKEEIMQAVRTMDAYTKLFIDEISKALQHPRGFEVAKGFEEKPVTIPERATYLSAGYDLRSIEEKTVPPHERVNINTGIKARMLSDEVLLLYPRSSLGIKKGLNLANGVAVIDSDYYSNPENDGHIIVCLYNMTDTPQKIEAGERVAQAMFSKFYTLGDVPTRVRRGGIGSTGKM